MNSSYRVVLESLGPREDWLQLIRETDDPGAQIAHLITATPGTDTSPFRVLVRDVTDAIVVIKSDGKPAGVVASFPVGKGNTSMQGYVTRDGNVWAYSGGYRYCGYVNRAERDLIEIATTIVGWAIGL